MRLHIKNMVCDRCIMVVRGQLESLNFRVVKIALGEVDIEPPANDEQMFEISSSLKLLGFELIDNEKEVIIAQIKNIVIEQIHHKTQPDSNINFSMILASALQKDYTYLSRLFSEMEDTTLAKYIIQQKIEKVKELIQYGQLNLNEIAFIMGYSSSAHLSAQFKQVTGLSPSLYRSSDEYMRKPIDKV